MQVGLSSNVAFLFVLFQLYQLALFTEIFQSYIIGIGEIISLFQCQMDKLKG